ncbi:unnamed protein product [Pseudo-nitzschia multistriata]|uniref:RING-type domain-containing protein n=1 Tax=Pseudo-nitzschia multistriata TaxID=183589 RepID=A0A448ZGN7_9STRA|nr:unnamed protein product [Pseudo-nitzschia multistriata]
MDLTCVICTENFDLKEHIPVVLPCGHTYICRVCVKKIKICHQCREPLYWTPPRPQPPPHSITNHPHRSPATGRYSRYNNRYSHTHSPSTPPHPGTGVTKPEEIPLPCPKNVVLMEVIEAKQRQERLMAEQKARKDQKRKEQRDEKERKRRERREEQKRLRASRQADTTPGSYRPGTHCDGQLNEIEVVDIEGDQVKNHVVCGNDGQSEEEEDYDYDDEISSSSSSTLPLGDPELNSGYAALSGTCGTYAVREPEGLVVLPYDPTRPKHHITTSTQQQRERQEPMSDEKKEDEFEDISRKFSSLFTDNAKSSDAAIALNDNKGGSCAGSRTREPFTIEQGQKVQVVGVLESNDQGVYQLARGRGYVVATTKQLVKVGGPMETSCKLEGMLQSVMGKQQELHKKLNQVTDLSMMLRKEIILEQDKTEEVPVITPSIQKKSASGTGVDEKNGDAHPTTPTKRLTAAHSHSPAEGSLGVTSIASADSTAVELGMENPRTPCPPSTTASGSYVEEHPLAAAYNRQQYHPPQTNHYAYSPAHSCPTPTNHVEAAHLEQPFLDDDSTYGSGVLRYRVNNDDEMSGMGWAGVLGCGSSLFGERLLQPTQREADAAGTIFHSTANVNREFLGMAENSLIQNSNVQRRAEALAQVAAAGATTSLRQHRTLESSGSADSPLRRGGSFDAGVGGGSVNFRGGYSNHGGLGRTRRNLYDQQGTHNRNASMTNAHHSGESHEPRRQLMMSQMSQHRGVGVASIQRRGLNADLVQMSSSR